MSAEYRGPFADSNANDRRSNSELWGQWGSGEPDDANDTYSHSAVFPSPPSTIGGQHAVSPTSQEQPSQEQFSYREHVTGVLPPHSSDAPLFRPAYMPYPPQQGRSYPPVQAVPPGQSYPYSPGYLPQSQSYLPYPSPDYPPYQGYPTYQAYSGYPAYNGYSQQYAWQPLKPKTDGLRLAVCIISLSGSILASLGGLASIGVLLLFLLGAIGTRGAVTDSQVFSSIMTFTGFVVAGLVGGGFGIYHSIRGLMQRSSAKFGLPWFWVFLIPYLSVLGIGYALRANGQEVAMPFLTIFLIILAAIFPALAIAAIGVRQLRFPEWPTTWRRFILALTSGATSGIGLALLLELGFLVLLFRGQADNLKCINDPTLPGCSSFTTFNLIFIVVAIIGPVVEETVKPLAVAFFIGRIRSASEAFVLGMGAGLGFAVIETLGYIGSGYHDWLYVALERTGAGLLHGFGAAMVALGWYYLTHAKEHRLRKAVSCWAYAVFQHFVWNGTAVLSYLPDPVGSTLNSWNLNLGFATLSFFEILNILESVLILIFFIYMAKRVRRQEPPPTSLEERKVPLSVERTTWQPQGVSSR